MTLLVVSMPPQESTSSLVEVGEHSDLSPMKSMCSSMSYVVVDCSYPHKELAP